MFFEAYCWTGTGLRLIGLKAQSRIIFWSDSILRLTKFIYFPAVLRLMAAKNFNLLEKYFWRTFKISCLFIATRAKTSSSNVKSGSQFSILLNSSLVGLLLFSSVGSKILHFSWGILSSLARCRQWGAGGSSFRRSVIWSSKSESSRISLTGSSPETK